MQSSRPVVPRPQPRGFALPMVMIALVLIGALISGAYFLSQQEFRTGRSTLTEQGAFAVAEYGMGSAIKNWDRQQNVDMAIGGMRGPDTVRMANGNFAVIRISRLNEFTFWAVSEGFAANGNVQQAARRRINEALRIAYPTFNIRGALTVRGQVEVQGSSKVNGNDSIPSQWSTYGVCPPPGSAMPGVAAPDTTQVCSGTCPGTGAYRIYGNPPEAQDPVAADTNTYFKYGDQNWQTLTAKADVQLPGGNYKPQPNGTSTSCNMADPLNWGDPFRTTACDDYFPIIYVKGSLSLQANSYGQGILLVEGDMQLAGGFEFNGIVIVRDDIKTTGTGNKISGAVFAGNTYTSDNSSIAGNAEIKYSSCAIDRATKASAALVRAKQRGWAEIF